MLNALNAKFFFICFRFWKYFPTRLLNCQTDAYKFYSFDILLRNIHCGRMWATFCFFGVISNCALQHHDLVRDPSNHRYQSRSTNEDQRS